MFDGLVSRLERNQLLDELCGGLNSLGPRSMSNKLEGFAFGTDVPSGERNTASSAYQETELLRRY